MDDLERFFGFWRLRSFQQDINGEVFYPFGPSPTGTIIYSPLGMMSVQLGREPFPSFGESLGTAGFDPDEEPPYAGEASHASQEKICEVLDSYLAYYGHYQVNFIEKTVTHFVEGGNHPAFRGRRLLRRYSFSHDQLLLSPVSSGGIAATLVWEKLNSVSSTVK